MGEMQAWPTQVTTQVGSSPWTEIGGRASSQKKQHSDRYPHQLSSCRSTLDDPKTAISTNRPLIGPDVDLSWLMFC